MSRTLRVAVGGVHIESSTFSPHLSGADDFEVTRGDTLLARYDWLAEPWAADVEWIPLVHARALPGGAVTRAAYDAWAAEIAGGLAAAGPLDGVLLDIHGAMSVVGMEDAEGDLVTVVRSAIGPGPFVSAAMDLHGNVSHRFFAACDLLTCYRTAPHVDVWETRERAARNLVEALRRGERPHKALVHVPILLPGEMTSTRVEPARGLYAR
ncbi:MAG: M81 family metallopeptidase, partial [Nonomuraea sp.]|nr:M81 family metallopeptidase [Nonomuraea sp.]